MQGYKGMIPNISRKCVLPRFFYLVADTGGSCIVPRGSAQALREIYRCAMATIMCSFRMSPAISGPAISAGFETLR
jgi:hypothetical protein